MTAMELIASAALLSVVLALYLRQGRTRPIGLLVAVSLSMGLAWAFNHFYQRNPRPHLRPELEVTGRPVAFERAGYVTSRTCQACHPDQYHSWHRSYHRTMTQVADAESVLGDFEGRTLRLNAIEYRAMKKDGGFWIEMPDPEFHGPPAQAPRVRREVVLTTGSHHMQVYWYATGETRKLGQFPIVYLLKEERWLPRNSAFLRPPAAPFTQETARWNITCVRCHTTHGRGRIQGPRNIQTDVAEFGIACEACHGPAQRHLAVYRSPIHRYEAHLYARADHRIVNPARLPPDRSSQVCGQCHGIFEFSRTVDALEWSEKGYPYRPGDDLNQTRIMVQYDEHPDQAMMRQFLKNEPDYMKGRFWSDGMVRISGREYTAMVKSPCSLKGDMSCLSCHSMHHSRSNPIVLGDWIEGQLKHPPGSDQACLQCHGDLTDRLTDHTHHAAGSAGSRCYNCHMPHTTYGLLKAIRSHQIDSPSVAATVRTGRPNACNLCHLDKTQAWTVSHLTRWYGMAEPRLSEAQKTVAASVLWMLAGDAGQRALIAWAAGWGPARQASGTDWMPPFLSLLLLDPYDAVRLIAGRSLRTLPGFGDVTYRSLSSLASRKQVRQAVMARWEGRETRPRAGPSRQILIGDDGRLMRAVFDWLLSQRDDRPMNLKE